MDGAGDEGRVEGILGKCRRSCSRLRLAEWLVPNVVPVGYSEQPPPSWAVLAAFALRSIELTAAWVAGIALTLLCGAWLLARLRGRPARLTR
jgi:hypothetical protein